VIGRNSIIGSIALLALLAGCGGGGGGGGSPSPSPGPAPVDTAPDTFTFTNQSATATGATVTSNQITVTGINTAAAVSITGGEYSINGGAFTSAAGTIANGQTIAVRITTTGQFSTQFSATLTIGGVSAVFTATTEDADPTPQAFLFVNNVNVALGAMVTSNSATITAINTSAPVSITGGEYSINGGAFTSAAGTISNNQTIAVRVSASGQFSTPVSATLTVGGVSVVFTATTLAADTTPDAFVLPGHTGVLRNILVTSASSTVAGINAPAPVSVTGGEYSIEGGAFTAAAGTISNNQRIQVRVRSSGQFSTAVSAALTVGGVSVSFTATTYAEDTTPDAFEFQRTTNNVRGSLVFSNTVPITGINNTTPVTIQNGEFSVAGGAYRTSAGSIEPGQTITLRARASSVYSKTARATVTVGGVSADFLMSTELPNYTPDDVEFDGTDVVYLLSSANRLVFRWSLVDGRYLDPHELSQSLDAPTQMAYSGAHQRLYLGYSTGAIRYLNPSSVTLAETGFTTMSAGVSSLSSAGNFLVAQVGTYSYGGGNILNSSGVTVGYGGYVYGYSRETAWDPVNSRLYYTLDGLSPNDLVYDVINQTTGQVTTRYESPYHGDYSISGPIRVSANGQRILLGTGDFYAHDGLSHTGWLGVPIADARWLADGSLVTLRTANNQTVLRRLGGNTLNTLEQLPYTGEGLRVLGTDQRMAVLVVNNGTVQIHTYVPSDDSDGDGVANTQDAFPLDVAASADSDHDGFPDGWNDGRSQADSTSGLSLDAFAQDSACWLASHGSGAACNYTATLPNYDPDQVISHGDIVYLLSRDNRRVYRWSISAEQYLNPYVVGNNPGFSTLAPVKIAYSSAHERLYLAYGTGAISYIDVTASNPVEVPLTSVGAAINQLSSAGNFVVAQYGTYYYAGTSHVIDSSGVIRDEGGTYTSTSDTTWDPVTSRLYYVVDSYNVYYDVINQATGEVTSSGYTASANAYLRPPVRVSVNGQRILLGSGDHFGQSGLTWTGSLGSPIADARWFADGSLVTLSTASNQSVLRRLNGATLLTQEQLPYAGEGLRVVGSDTRMALVLFDGTTVQFQIYVPDNDTDDDGVPNTLDAFPTDPAASVDSDLDGYPDAWNNGMDQDDSTTGLQLDAFPQDSACWASAHGSGGTCNYAATVPNYTPDKVEQHGDIIYLLSNTNRRVYRWSISGRHYLNPYVVGLNQGVSPILPTSMAFSSSHQRLYLGYGNGSIQYIDLNASAALVPFAYVPMGVRSLSSAGNFLLAQANVQYDGGYIINSAGSVTPRTGFNYGYSRETAWDPNFNRIYYYRDNTSPNDLLYDEIDQVTGAVTGPGESPYHGEYPFGGVVRVTSNGNYILTGSGDIFSRAANLAWSGSVGAPISDARWFANGSMVALTTSGNQTQLRRLSSSNLTVLEQRSFAGEALRVVGSDTEMVVLAIDNGAVRFHYYSPDDDSDDDTVQNTQDAFPQDVAASIDTDRDGYPNAWNTGRSQADSTSVPALALDAFPNDSACWLASHGSGGVCNYGATVPNYIPDQVAQNGNVVYLLSSANRRVYRWSISAGAYLNPYIVGNNQGVDSAPPAKMEYSASHQRLYLGYSSGAVRRLDVTAGNPAETAFVTLSGSINRLTSASNFLVAQAGTYYSSNSSHVIDSAGVTRDTGGSYYYSSYDTTWDPFTSRLYYVSSGYYNLYYDELNQTTGEFGASGSAPYNSNVYLQPPARISPNGQRVLLGSGDFLAQNLSWLGSLGWQFTDARWFADGSLATLVPTGGLTTLLHLGSANFVSLETRQYTGQPLRILGSDTAMAVLVLNNNAVQIHAYVPSTDSDGDGVLNTADAFPLDVAASVDTDGDGHPNSWNIGYGQSDSTTGLTLDSFPTDVACWAPGHGSGGVCNQSATVGDYRPDLIAQNGDIVYLLSGVNRRVYRWSIATGTYLSPYVIGSNAPYSSLAPTAMAYSTGHQRLYLGYANGAIRYIDVNAATPVETTFTTLSQRVNVLANAGNFLLAQREGNYGGLVLNSAGATMDTSDYYYGYSYQTAWDPVSSRVYYVDSGVLRYEVIDQTTGQIGATGQSAYSPQAFAGPIRVSADGSQIVLANGNVYSRNGLTQTGSLGKPIADAYWKDNILVDADNTGLVEIRDATTLAVLQSYQQVGQPLRVVFGTSEAYLVHLLNDSTVAFWRMPFYDGDGDAIPRWWEQLYAGMSDASAADATTDLDGDGVNNRLEYQSHSNPLVTDTDADGLTDSQEIGTYHTDPSRKDTDGDGLSDQAEVITHHTDPLDTDTDNDNYSDLIEVLYGGNPNDGTVLPQPLYNYSQTFENTPNLASWITPPQTTAAWAVDTTAAHSGSASFKAGAVGNSQSSAVRFRGFFRPGRLTFWARADTPYYNYVYVFIDGVSTLSISTNGQWYPYEIQIPVGVHEIEWRFDRYYTGGQPTESAWIDDVTFVGQ